MLASLKELSAEREREEKERERRNAEGEDTKDNYKLKELQVNHMILHKCLLVYTKVTYELLNR